MTDYTPSSKDDMPAPLTIINDAVIIDDDMRSEAATVLGGSVDGVERFLVVVEGHAHEVPENVSRLLLHVLKQAADGETLTIRTMPEELTTTAAADILGISRPTLMKLIANGEIAAHSVGSHKRLAAHDVIELKNRRLAAQEVAFATLRLLDV